MKARLQAEAEVEAKPDDGTDGPPEGLPLPGEKNYEPGSDG